MGTKVALGAALEGDVGIAVAAGMGCVMLHSQGGAACGVHSPVDVTGVYLPGSEQTCYALSQEVMVWGSG